MSILIKGMEIPSVGTGKVIMIDSDGDVWSGGKDQFDIIDGAKAISVPPHGRLGDLDTLAERIEFEVQHYVVKDEFDKGRIAAWNNILRAIREYTPTIIPAESPKEE